MAEPAEVRHDVEGEQDSLGLQLPKATLHGEFSRKRLGCPRMKLTIAQVTPVLSREQSQWAAGTDGLRQLRRCHMAGDTL